MSVDHYENFPVASVLLPRRLRGPVTDIYRFARSADDIADEGDAPDAQRLGELAAYRTELYRIASTAGQSYRPVAERLAPVFMPLAATIARQQLPITPFLDLLSAFEQDITVKRYADEAALLDYCARSANPVGRLMLHLYGVVDATALRQSDAICTGLQLVNFWQDVRVDWYKDRVYLPQDALQRHGVSEEDLAACRLTPQWQALLGEQVARTRALLHSGAPLTRRLPGRIGLELRLVVQGGLRILERIEQARYDVFMNRPELGGRDWCIMLGRALFRRSAG
ncbi:MULTISPECIES: squalene synthase HpnC [unclassified Achromobacter]|uniref:squalene synthase HpnC n=1 Tax=unclassified Achromobacter TaxID=2626865 RepID=UPI000B51D609|nr:MULTISPECIES: squalene synthase HpnC [unclassified Achromobacter]OWT70148.1 squalene synthase HpnC [Achromobacter sp. HZ34]OWT71687.1 squalene synthase HpnC [Achromobacter sp. HZ28]